MQKPTEKATRKPNAVHPFSWQLGSASDPNHQDPQRVPQVATTVILFWMHFVFLWKTWNLEVIEITYARSSKAKWEIRDKTQECLVKTNVDKKWTKVFGV